MNMLRWKSSVVVVCVALFMGGCDGTGKLSDAQYVQKAEELIDRNNIGEAVIHLKNALRENPKNPRARWLLGQVYTEIGNGAAAEKELRMAQELGVVEESVLPLLARALFLQKEYDKVIRLSPQGSLSDKQRSEFLSVQASAFLAQREFENAQERITEALELSPESEYALTNKARLLVGLEKADEALALLKKVVERAPKYAPAWSILGDLHGVKGEAEEALEALNKAVENRYNNAGDTLKRALMEIQLGKFEDAQRDIAYLKRRKVASVDYARGLLHFAKKEYADANDAFLAELNRAPNHFFSMFYSALTNAILGNYAQSEEMASRIVSVLPQYAPGRKLLAFLKARKGDFKGVEELLRPLVEGDKKEPFVVNLLSSALLRLGKAEEAASLLESMVEVKPGSVNTRVRYAAALSGTGNMDRVTAQLKAAIEVEPASQMANVMLVKSYLESDQWEMAVSAAQEYRENNQGSSRPYVLLGLLYLNHDQAEEAAGWFRKALEIEPGNQDANRYLAKLALREGDLETARKHYQDILQHHEGDLAGAMDSAMLEAKEKNYSAMENQLRSAIKAHPLAVRPRVLLARHKLEQGKGKEAFELLKDVETQGSGNADFLALFGASQFAVGLNEQAKETYERLLEKASHSPRAYYLMVLAYARIGDGQKVEKTLERAVTRFPKYIPTRSAYTRLLLKKGDLQGAKRSLEILRKSTPDIVEVKFLEGLIAGREKDWGKAEKIFEEIYEQSPNSATMRVLSEMYWNAGNREKSLELQKEWISKQPQDLDSRMNLADAYVTLGRSEEARAQYQEILIRDQNNGVALNNLAWQLRDSDPERALEYAQKAVDLNPDSWKMMETLATLYAKNGDGVRAERTVDRALALAPDNSGLKYRKAVVLRMIGKPEQAIETLTGILSDAKSAVQDKEKAERLLRSLKGEP